MHRIAFVVIVNTGIGWNAGYSFEVRDLYSEYGRCPIGFTNDEVKLYHISSAADREVMIETHIRQLKTYVFSRICAAYTHLALETELHVYDLDSYRETIFPDISNDKIIYDHISYSEIFSRKDIPSLVYSYRKLLKSSHAYMTCYD